MIINHNLMSFMSFNSLKDNNDKLQKSIKALSTGLRISSAADDAAGLAISEKMRSQIAGLDAAAKNSQDGISLLQTAEGGLSDTHAALQRMRELAVQAANDTLTANDRQYVQLEMDELKKQINKISDTTQFNKKKLLNGSSGAIWSSSDPGIKAVINGSLTQLDNFGQRVSHEGNYRIEISASGGQAQVLKSQVMAVSVINYDKTSWPEININMGVDSLGATEGEGWEFEDGLLSITEDGTYTIYGNGQVTTNRVYISGDVNATIILDNVNIRSGESPFNISGANVDMYLKNSNTLECAGGTHGSGIQTSNSSKLTISSAAGDFKTAGTLNATGSTHGAGIGGSCASVDGGDNDGGTITIKGGTIKATGGFLAAGIGGGTEGGSNPGAYRSIKIEGGDVTAIGGAGGAGIGTAGTSEDEENYTNDGLITIVGGSVTAIANGGSATVHPSGAGVGGGAGFDSGKIIIGSGASINASGYRGSGHDDNSNVTSGSIGIGEWGEELDVTYTSSGPSAARELPNALDNGKEPLALSEIKNFYNSEGVSVVSEPQTLKITQGNGKTASITLYKEDTMEDVAKKINDAIANTLGQSKYVDNASKFCTLSDGSKGSESVSSEELVYRKNGELQQKVYKSTMLIRSAVAGKDGELYFSGSEELLNALGLNTIQESQEADYTASVYDAHSGKMIASDVTAASGKFKNLIAPNVDVEVDTMSGLKANWNDKTKKFVISGGEKYSAVLHLADNSTVFQVGANEGENFEVQLGDTSCDALGISNIIVLDHDTASRAITQIDNAIDKVSTQRAKIGAYQNALEHTMNNLISASANLTDSESVIRDADMAKTMMNFAKLQILTQSGTSMLSQANQLPSAVLSLLH